MGHSLCIYLAIKTCFLGYARTIFDKKKIALEGLILQISIKKVEELTSRLEKLGKENKILYHENVVHKSDIATLKVEIEELKALLESSSRNSNKPPSSDGYKKETVKPAFPKSKGSKRAGAKRCCPTGGKCTDTIRQLPSYTPICLYTKKVGRVQYKAINQY